MRRSLVIAMAALSLAACTDGGGPVPVVGVPAPHGPPRIRDAVVARHAEQFDVDLKQRPAGSQEELAASSYLIAHLQKAGYVARLEPVPVADLVRSTDVIAVPPETSEPSLVVAIGYDTGSGTRDGGRALGTFLELARASLVADPGSSVWFAALGAQSVQGEVEYAGSKVLLRYLVDQGFEPAIFLLEPDDGPLLMYGPAEMLGGFMGRAADTLLPADAQRFFGRDYEDFAVIRGPVHEAGDALLARLRNADG